MRLAIAGFLIPFIFVYHPSVVLLEEGFSYVGLAWGVGAFIFSTAAIATSLGGFSRADIGFVQRTVRLIAGVTVLVPVPTVAAISAAVILGAFVVERMMGAMPVEQRADS